MALRFRTAFRAVALSLAQLLSAGAAAYAEGNNAASLNCYLDQDPTGRTDLLFYYREAGEPLSFGLFVDYANRALYDGSWFELSFTEAKVWANRIRSVSAEELRRASPNAGSGIDGVMIQYEIDRILLRGKRLSGYTSPALRSQRSLEIWGNDGNRAFVNPSFTCKRLNNDYIHAPRQKF